MSEIIRRPNFAGGGITEEEKQKMKEHSELWIARALRTDPIEPDKIIPAIKSLYAAADKKEPRVIIVPSPLVMAFAYGFSAAILYMRKKGGFKDGIKINNAISSATEYAIRNAIFDATYSLTCAATDDAISAAMGAATHSIISNITNDATEFATINAIGDATEVAKYDAIENKLNKNWAYELALNISGNHDDALFMLNCANRWWAAYQGGNMWASYNCYLTAARDILGLRLPSHEKYATWEQCAIHGGFRVMHEDFCIVSDFPAILKKDDQHRPHCDDGPSHLWRDGWALYHIHGVRISDEKKHIVLAPETITVEEIEKEENAEIRRVMMERYGYERYIHDCNAEIVEVMPDDHPIKGLRTAKLLVKHVPDDESIVFVDLLNSTPEPDGSVRRYLMRVDPNAYNGDVMRSCHAATASTWRNSIDGELTYKNWKDYSPKFES